MKMDKFALLVLFLVLGVNLYFRAYPLWFPQLKKDAIQQVRQQIYNDMQNKAQKDYPDFHLIAIDTLAKKMAKEYEHNNKQAVAKQIKDKYNEFKKPLQHNGKTFLMELDCWHWARYVKNIVLTGHPGDSIKGGRQWDDYMTAPQGQEVAYSRFSFYLTAWLYKPLKRLVSFDDFIFWVPLFYAAILLIVLFCFMRYYFGIFPAMIACLFVGLASIFLNRSFAGWFKTDSFNVLFPLLIVWTYLLARNSQFPFGWLMLSAFLVGLFSYTWTGWWYIIPIIGVFELLKGVLR
jgi:hypothetical protein